MMRLSARISRAGRVLVSRKGGLPDRELLAPLARWFEIDMDEARTREEAEAEEPGLARRRLEGRQIEVRQGLSDILCLMPVFH